MNKFLLFITTYVFCFSIGKADYWTQKANIPGGLRYSAVGFSVNNKGYVGTGYGNSIYLDDFWEYDPSINAWTQRANFPGGTRYFATGFSIGSKGYIGLGHSPSNTYQDFWEYDPLTDTWTQKADFAGGVRGYPGIGFEISGYGYVGLGFANIDHQDFWQYDPATNSWLQKASFPGLGREQVANFSMGNKLYVGCGVNSASNTFLNDFYEYDVVTDSWTALANFPALSRVSMAAFSINQLGYVGTGFVDTLGSFTCADDFWQYNPVNNAWIQKTNFGGIARSHDISFSIGNKGYVGSGYGGTSFLDDFWEYTPDSTTSIDNVQLTNNSFSLFPNPAKDFTVLNFNFPTHEKLEITITDVKGKIVYKLETVNSKSQIVNTSSFSNGVYLVSVTDGKQKAVKKIIKE